MTELRQLPRARKEQTLQNNTDKATKCFVGPSRWSVRHPHRPFHGRKVPALTANERRLGPAGDAREQEHKRAEEVREDYRRREIRPRSNAKTAP